MSRRSKYNENLADAEELGEATAWKRHGQGADVRVVLPGRVAGTVYLSRGEIEDMAGGPLPLPARTNGGVRCLFSGMRNARSTIEEYRGAGDGFPYVSLEAYTDHVPAPGQLITLNGGSTYVVTHVSWFLQERERSSYEGDAAGPADLEICYVGIEPRDLPGGLPRFTQELVLGLESIVRLHGGDWAASQIEILGYLSPLLREHTGEDATEAEQHRQQVAAARRDVELAQQALASAERNAGFR